jgi:hypothetical protein
MRQSFRWLTCLCLSLMLWTVAAESTHNHPVKTGSASCSICVVAHSTAPAASSHQGRPVVSAIGILQDEEFSAKARLSVFDFGIRGPPAV